MGKADAARGRFRSYFLGALRLHLAEYGRRASAQKRGDGRRTLPLESAEEVAVASAQEVQERAFDRQRAMSLLAAAAEDLRREMVAAGQRRHHTAGSGNYLCRFPEIPFRRLQTLW